MSEKKPRKGNIKVTRTEWLEHAQTILIHKGAAFIKIDRMAKELGVTRGGFYWHFTNRQALLDALLERWQKEQDPYLKNLRAKDIPPKDRIRALFNEFISEEYYVPSLDAAIREWARTSEKAATAIENIDQLRISALADTFCDMGYDKDEAFIRGRIFYYHQVGYYTLDVEEDPTVRAGYRPLYLKILVGEA